MTPAFYISVGGADVTGNFNDRLLELTVTDNEGSESDTVNVVVDDRDGILGIPEKGASMAVGLGYKETGIMPMGMFIVDEVKVEGWPRKMSIRGRAAEMRDDFKGQRSKGYENKTIKDIVGEIAQRHGLAAKVIGSIASFNYKYLAQGVESDLHFITRLARKHDCVATAKGGKLIFCKKGEGDLGMVVITYPGQIKKYECTFQDRPRHKKAKGSWWDFDEAKRVVEEGMGNAGAEYELGNLWPDGKEEAKETAQSKADALGREEKVATFEVVGNPAIMAEMNLMVVGVRAGVDGLYRIKSAEHKLNNSGYSTSISTELPRAQAGNDPARIGDTDAGIGPGDVPDLGRNPNER
jgi:hypothetical protein